MKTKSSFPKITAFLENDKQMSLDADEFMIQIDPHHVLAISYDKENDELICIASPTDKQGGQSLNKSAHLDIRPLCGNVIRLTVSSYVDKQKARHVFQDITVDGIGNLSKLRNTTIKQLKNRLLKTKHYALYIPNTDPPSGWPKEIIRYKKKKGKDPKTFIRWCMNLDGKKWQQQSELELELYASVGLTPAMIYEKKVMGNKRISYRPIVDLGINKKGQIKWAVEVGCD